MSLRSRVSMLACGLAAAVIVSVFSSPARAGNYTWDPAGDGSLSGGTGTWNTSSWYSGTESLWNDNNVAFFQGTGGLVTLNTQVTPTGLTFSSSGYTISSGGTVNFNGGATIATNAASATINSPVILNGNYQLNVSGTGALTLGGGLTGGTNSTLYENSGTGLLTVYQPAGSSATIGTVSGQSGTTVVLGGDPTSTTAIAAVNTVGQTVEFNGGNWNLLNGGAYQSSIVVNSGMVTRPAANYNGTGGDFFQLRSVTVHGGTLSSQNAYGMRMGNQYGANDNSGLNFTGVQDGGLVTVANGPQLGSISNGITASYTLSGGTFSATSFLLGAGTLGTGTTTLTLSGSGYLNVNGTISGSQGAGAQQVFNFQGGTLVAAGIDARQLSGTTAPTVQGFLYNTGGTLAPGGIGVTGRTVITGNYVQSGGALAIDIGGTTQANGFQNGQYDYLSVSGSATVGGALNVGLINGYLPTLGASFTVLGAGSPITGSFSNVPNATALTMGGESFGVYYGSAAASPHNVTVVTIAGSNASIWTNTTGDTWGTSSNWNANGVPNAPASIAILGSALTASGPVTLAQATTVGVLSFINTASYTVSPGTGPYTLTLNNNSSTAQINDYGGTHVISAPIAVAGNNNLNVTVYDRTDSLTLSGGVSASGTLQSLGAGNLTISGSINVGTLTQTNTSGTLTVYEGASSSGSIGTVNGASGSTVVLTGDPTSTTSIYNTLSTGGQTVIFNGGTWNLTYGGGYQSNLVVNGGLVTRGVGQGSNNQGDFNGLVSLTVSGGTLISSNTYGMRMGNAWGSNTGGGNNFTGVQTGGLVSVTGLPELGSADNGYNATYTLSGGTYSCNNFFMGNGTAGTGTTTLTLSGSGYFSVAGTILGQQGAGAQQVFNFQGGTLVASAINASKLAGAAAPAVQGTLYNTGGTLAPGGIGVAGKTTITGNYVQSAGALAIDIGGTTQANAFQGGAGQYDFLQVNSGTATVGGALNVALTNGYLPATGTTFTVLTAANPIAGSFTNVASGGLLTMPGNSALLGVYYGSGASSPNSVTLTMIAGSNASIWSNTTGGTWDNSANWNATGVPNAAGAVAFFGPALLSGGTVAMPNSTYTAGILSFLNTAASYTVGSGTTGGLLALNNNTSNAQINDYGGSHTITVPVVVLGNNNLNITVVNTPDTLTLSNGVFGSGTLLYAGAGNLTIQNGAYPIGALTDNAVGTLSIGGSLGATGAVQNSGSGNMSISGGASMGSLTNSGSGNMTISGGATVVGAVQNSGSGNMTISGGASMGSLTNSSTGYLTINNGAAVVGAVTNSASAGNLTFPGGLTAATLTNNSTAGTVSVTQPALSSGTIGTIQGASGTTVLLMGDSTSTTTIAHPLNTPGQTVKFNGGTWILATQDSYQSNLEVDSGFVTRPAGTGDFFDLRSLTVHGGTLSSQNQYGMRMGNQYGAQYVGDVDVPFTGVQDGGLVSVNGSNVDLGTAASGFTDSYTLSGGTFSITNGQSLRMGAAASGSGSTTFTLAGNGKLSVSGNIYGIWGGSAQQIFDFHGGTLVANTITATLLSGTAAPAAQGTFYNTGGTLAPGDVGTAGQTIIQGNYVQSGGALAIDIGGTTQASGFQSGQYDYLAVSGSATLGGALNVGLINGYVPATGTNFTIVNAGTVIGGSFSNVPNDSLLAMAGNIALFGVFYGSGAPAGYNSNQVTLTTIAGSNASIWNNSAAGSWGNSLNWNANGAPGGSGAIAFFGTALTSGGTVGLAAPTTVGVVSFLNPAAGYTVGPGTGSYTLTFNNGVSDAQINDYAGTHGISAPIAVAGNNNLDVTTVSATDSLTLSGGVNLSGTLQASGSGGLTISGALSGNGGLAMNGPGILTLAATNNTYHGGTTVNGGAIVLANSAAVSPNSAWTINTNNGLLFGNGVTAAALPSLGGNGNLTLTSSDGLAVTLSVDGNGQNSIFNGTISGSGGLTKLGNDSLTLTNALGYNGQTTVSAGTLVLPAMYGNISTVVNSGAVLNLNVPSGSSQNLTTGTLSGGGELLKTGSGIFYFKQSTPNTLFVSLGAGSLIDIEGGVLGNNYSAVNWNANQSSIYIASAGTMDLHQQNIPCASLNGSGVIQDSFNTGTNTLTVGLNNASGTFSGIIYGAGTGINLTPDAAPVALLKTGTGTLLLAGTSSTYSAGTTINHGTLGIAGDGSLGAATGSVTFSGNSTLQADAAAIVLSSSRTVTINNSVIGTIDTQANNMTISGPIYGSGELTKLGGGTLILSGTDTYAGGTDVEGGTLQVMNSNAVYYDTGLIVGTNGTVDIGAPTGAAAIFVARSSPAASSAGAVAAVPEPGTLALLAVGALAAAMAAWRRRKGS